MNKVVGKRLRSYPEKTYSHAVAAVDVVLFRFVNNELEVLLLKLKEKPFSGKYALPGGLVINKETLETSAMRHLSAKAGISEKVYLEQLYTFGDPGRDPLGWVISVAFLGLTANKNLHLNIATRYALGEWFSVNNLPEMAYDHEEIIKIAVKRLASKMGYTNIASFLLEKKFTLTELQNLYERILGHSLDKRNFRKKILSLKLVKPTKKFKKDVPQRPARLFTFSNLNLIEANIL